MGIDEATARPATRRAVVTVGVFGSVTALAGCTGGGGGGGGDGSKDAAAKLAAALQSGRFAGSPVTTAGADTEYATVVQGLSASRRTVTVAGIADGTTKSTKTVMLQTSWTLPGGRPWSYRHPATMTRTDGKWTTPWTSSLVHPSLAAGSRLVALPVPAKRADILGGDGKALVTYRAVYRVGIDKTKVKGAAASSSATKLAGAVEIDAPAYAKSVAASGASAFVEAIVLRTEAVPDAKAASIRAIPGAVLLPDDRPLAPSATFARSILGTVTPATAESVAKSKGTVTASDLVGSGGLQQQYDGQLRGSAALRVSAVPATGDPRQLVAIGGTAPKPLRTTIRQDLQTTAEKLLAGQSSPSAIVAIRPSTGEVVAAASGSGSKGYDTALLGRYAPGSTFKVVSSLALLRSGLTIDSTVQCTPTISVQGRVVKNFPDYPKDKLGAIPFRTAIANSCNTVMIRGADQASQQSLATAADSLGLTQNPTDGPYFGSVPAGDSGAEHQVSMIGQGRVLASPLGMATVAASVVRGARVTPYLLPDHKPTVSKPPATPLTSAEATALRTLMRGVVTEGGATGLQSVPGPPVIAKTGTAEYGGGTSPKTHSWMIAGHGDLAVAVFVETGGYGGVTCLPIMKSFLTSAQSA